MSEPAPIAREPSYGPTVAAGILTLLTSILAFATTGAALGLVIATLTFATLITAPLIVAARGRATDKLLVLVASLAGTGAIWLAAFVGPLGFLIVLKMLSVLGGYLLAIGGIAVLLARVKFEPTVAAAIAVTLALAWLSWPIWLSGHLSEGHLTSMLVWIHPILAINGLSDTFGVWTQQHLMYRLTALGQDIPFALPRSVFPCLLTHAVFGTLCIMLSAPRASRRL